MISHCLLTKMKQFQVFYLPILILIFLTSNAEALDYAKKGCQERCDGMVIPYPFGIGSNCSVNEWYAIDCKSKPYLSAFNNLEVLNIGLETQTITVSRSLTHDPFQNNISQILSIDLNGSPFIFSKSHNIFVTQGCGNAVITSHGKVIAGCSTNCRNDTFTENTNCFGIICCRTTIPTYLKSYRVDFTRLESLGRDGSPGSAFLMDERSHQETFYFNPLGNRYMVRSFDVVTLLWTLTQGELNKEAGCWESASESGRKVLYLDDGKTVVSRKCYCGEGREGNPYLHYQCQASEECSKCEASGNVCTYKKIELDERSYTWSLICVHPRTYGSQDFGSKKSPMGVIVGVSISMGLLFLAKFIYELHKLIKKAISKKQKKKFFSRNGGLLLKKQVAMDVGSVDKTILFTSKELEAATDHFNENRILGRGGQGTVYKGMLSDGRIVAVKKSKSVNESQLEPFINEVVILSQVNHRNVVKLLGCCLETEVPILVSEFISNGTLYDLIQNNTIEFPFSLDMRLQIATQVAGALAYLHSATSIPIYHRDIKTTNILMDENFRAKVSDFGTSRFVSIDQTHLTTLVKGTFGYFDPEYFQSSQFTEKSDVYSFGVVLLELLTREKPISITRFGEHRNLATHFMFAMEEGHMMSIFDSKVVNEESKGELLAIANLAMRCLNSNGKNRPTMKEVALELEALRTPEVPSTVDNRFGHATYSEDLQLFAYDASTSTTTSLEDDINE